MYIKLVFHRYKNGQEVTGDAHIKISRDSQRVENYNMTFTLVKVEDGGEYEVRASNEMGSAVTKTTVLVQSKSCAQSVYLLITMMPRDSVFESLHRFQWLLEKIKRFKTVFYRILQSKYCKSKVNINLLW